MIASPDLPVELHAEVLQFFHHYRDRPTLLTTALVCKDWRTLSQRCLFSAITDHWNDNYNRDQKANIMQTHTLFLQTIAEHPHRLGPLVRSYSLDSLMCNPEAGGMPGPADLFYELWELMEKALPAMINLEHLWINPLFDSLPARDGWASSKRLLKSFAFQLKTLTWRNYFHPNNGIPGFLRTQENLTHLEVGRYPFSLRLSWLEDDLCPNLVSVTGGLESLAHVSRSRQILAWKWYSTSEEEIGFENSSVLDSLKYLSVYHYSLFRRIFGPIDLGIHLLELEEDGWSISTLTTLDKLPRLQVLVLICGIITHDTDDIVQAALHCLKRLPCLEYIILRHSCPGEKQYRYAKLSLSQSSTEEILRERINLHYDLAAPWWTTYDV